MMQLKDKEEHVDYQKVNGIKRLKVNQPAKSLSFGSV